MHASRMRPSHPYLSAYTFSLHSCRLIWFKLCTHLLLLITQGSFFSSFQMFSKKYGFLCFLRSLRFGPFFCPIQLKLYAHLLANTYIRSLLFRFSYFFAFRLFFASRNIFRHNIGKHRFYLIFENISLLRFSLPLILLRFLLSGIFHLRICRPQLRI